jgi:hypothetical protein
VAKDVFTNKHSIHSGLLRKLKFFLWNSCYGHGSYLVVTRRRRKCMWPTAFAWHCLIFKPSKEIDVQWFTEWILKLNFKIWLLWSMKIVMFYFDWMYFKIYFGRISWMMLEGFSISPNTKLIPHFYLYIPPNDFKAGMMATTRGVWKGMTLPCDPWLVTKCAFSRSYIWLPLWTQQTIFFHTKGRVWEEEEESFLVLLPYSFNGHKIGLQWSI